MKSYWPPIRPVYPQAVQKRNESPPSKPTTNQPPIRFGLTELRRGLMQAAEEGNAEQCKALLLKDPANVNMIDEEGWTPLTKAAAKGRYEVITLLLDHGADVNMKGPNGATALLWAAEFGMTEAVIRLIEGGADLDAQLPDGRTARDIATENEDFIVFDILNRPKEYLPGWPFPQREQTIKVIPFLQAIHGILAKLDQRLRERSAVPV